VRVRVDADEAWQVTAQPGPAELAVHYRCPTCRRPSFLNLQLPTGGPVNNELWCHLCQVGAPVTVVRED
jgi:hypothetical protein